MCPLVPGSCASGTAAAPMTKCLQTHNICLGHAYHNPDPVGLPERWAARWDVGGAHGPSKRFQSSLPVKCKHKHKGKYTHKTQDILISAGHGRRVIQRVAAGCGQIYKRFPALALVAQTNKLQFV